MSGSWHHHHQHEADVENDRIATVSVASYSTHNSNEQRSTGVQSLEQSGRSISTYSCSESISSVVVHADESRVNDLINRWEVHIPIDQQQHSYAKNHNRSNVTMMQQFDDDTSSDGTECARLTELALSEFAGTMPEAKQDPEMNQAIQRASESATKAERTAQKIQTAMDWWKQRGLQLKARLSGSSNSSSNNNSEDAMSAVSSGSSAAGVLRVLEEDPSPFESLSELQQDTPKSWSAQMLEQRQREADLTPRSSGKRLRNTPIFPDSLSQKQLFVETTTATTMEDNPAVFAVVTPDSNVVVKSTRRDGEELLMNPSNDVLLPDISLSQKQLFVEPAMDTPPPAAALVAPDVVVASMLQSENQEATHPSDGTKADVTENHQVVEASVGADLEDSPIIMTIQDDAKKHDASVLVDIGRASVSQDEATTTNAAYEADVTEIRELAKTDFGTKHGNGHEEDPELVDAVHNYPNKIEVEETKETKDSNGDDEKIYTNGTPPMGEDSDNDPTAEHGELNQDPMTSVVDRSGQDADAAPMSEQGATNEAPDEAERIVVQADTAVEATDQDAKADKESPIRLIPTEMPEELKNSQEDKEDLDSQHEKDDKVYTNGTSPMASEDVPMKEFPAEDGGEPNQDQVTSAMDESDQDADATPMIEGGSTTKEAPDEGERIVVQQDSAVEATDMSFQDAKADKESPIGLIPTETPEELKNSQEDKEDSVGVDTQHENDNTNRTSPMDSEEGPTKELPAEDDDGEPNQDQVTSVVDEPDQDADSALMSEGASTTNEAPDEAERIVVQQESAVGATDMSFQDAKADKESPIGLIPTETEELKNSQEDKEDLVVVDTHHDYSSYENQIRTMEEDEETGNGAYAATEADKQVTHANEKPGQSSRCFGSRSACFWIVGVVLAVVVALAIAIPVAFLLPNNGGGSDPIVAAATDNQDRPSLAPSLRPSLFPSRVPSQTPSFRPSLRSAAPQGTPTDNTTVSWRQVGMGIGGGGTTTASGGHSVAISNDGAYVVVGSPKNGQAGNQTGLVRVFFRTSSDTWFQVGQNISGTSNGDNAGAGCAISANGQRVAVLASQAGNPGLGWVRVFAWNPFSLSWSALGQVLLGGKAGDKDSIALSRDGSTLVVGAVVEGIARVYRFVESTTQWERVGGVVLSGRRSFGKAVAVSSNGRIVAVSAPDERDAVANPSSPSNSEVAIFTYSSDRNAWIPMGAPLQGSHPLFGQSVALSGNGLTVAVGSPRHNSSTGEVAVYAWTNLTSTWTLVGSTIRGDNIGDQFGAAVSLSETGTRLAVGAHRMARGHAWRVFDYHVNNNNNNGWVPVGDGIDGETSMDRLGYDVALTGNGTSVVVGAFHDNNNNNSGDGMDSGPARVYEQIF